MPEPTDPANARLALRRLVSGLIRSGPADADATVDDLLARLDADELADYEQVLVSLATHERPRFARFTLYPDDPEQPAERRFVLDLQHADLHANGGPYCEEVAEVAHYVTQQALVGMLNDHPDDWAKRLADLNSDEPF